MSPQYAHQVLPYGSDALTRCRQGVATLTRCLGRLTVLDHHLDKHRHASAAGPRDDAAASAMRAEAAAADAGICGGTSPSRGRRAGANTAVSGAGWQSSAVGGHQRRRV